MFPTAPGGAGFNVTLADETATARFAADIAMALEPGDLVTLSGDLGAGKTTFARALIRLLAGDDTIEVPSPTFMLIQDYELPRFPLVHADFYRLSAAWPSSRSSASTICPRPRWFCWNGRTAPPARCRPTASTSPSRSCRSSARMSAMPASSATAPSRRARSASAK